MKHRFLLLFITFAFASCSSLKQTISEPSIPINDAQLTNTIQRSVKELLEGDWLSDYLTQKSERPILMNSKITSDQKFLFDAAKVYETIDLSLIQSGQVRVVKTNEVQRILTPSELAKGKSVDYVLSIIIQETDTKSPTEMQLILSLWDEKSSVPIFSIRNKIE